MKLLAKLALYCALFSKVYSLQCYECISTEVGQCTQTQKTCSAAETKCGSLNTAVYVGGSKLTEITTKSCAAPAACVSASFNFGISRTTVNTKCCDGNLCNTQDYPASADNTPNGKQCFTCEGEDCTRILKCLGSEDRCIKSAVTIGAQKVTVKGCASKVVCEGSTHGQFAGVGVDMSCCEGDLCNNGLRVGQSVLLLLVSLASIVLFH